MIIDGSDPFGDGRIAPGVERWLDAGDIDPSKVLVVPHIPRLIGGPKSDQFILAGPDDTPDTGPDPTATMSDVHDLAVPASGLGNWSDLFGLAEEQAARQYPAALLETQLQVSDAQQRGVLPETLFVPDAPNYSAGEYFRRLGRLAQDTGVEVVIPMRASRQNEGRLLRFAPPRAASVNDYWQHREETEFPPLTRTRIVGLAEEDVDVCTFLPNGYPPPAREVLESGRPDRELIGALRVVADAQSQRVQDALEVHPNADYWWGFLRRVAYGQEKVEGLTAVARTILAKADDGRGLEVLQGELSSHTGSYGYESAWMVPFGMYLRNRQELLAETIDHVDTLIAEGADDRGGELAHLLGGLYHTHRLEVGDYLSSHLIVPTGAGEHYMDYVLTSALRWLPGYIDAVRTMPDSPWQQEVLATIEGRVASLLEQMLDGQLAERGHTCFAHESSRVADMLLDFADPRHRDLLGRHMLALFQETGSVLEGTSPGRDTTFPRQYLRYRRLYGDIPEISNHIQIIQE